MLRRSILGLIVAGGILAASAVPSSAVQSGSHAHHVLLAAAFAPLNSKAIPYTGTLDLKIDADGIINGTYRSTSVRPDPFAHRINMVTGGVSGDNVNLRIGHTLSFNGKSAHGEWRGTATWAGRMYSFVARAH